eukprot:scpid56832/ scgid6875/ 
MPLTARRPVAKFAVADKLRGKSNRKPRKFDGKKWFAEVWRPTTENIYYGPTTYRQPKSKSSEPRSVKPRGSAINSSHYKFSRPSTYHPYSRFSSSVPTATSKSAYTTTSNRGSSSNRVHTTSSSRGNTSTSSRTNTAASNNRVPTATSNRPTTGPSSRLSARTSSRLSAHAARHTSSRGQSSRSSSRQGHDLRKRRKVPFPNLTKCNLLPAIPELDETCEFNEDSEDGNNEAGAKPSTPAPPPSPPTSLRNREEIRWVPYPPYLVRLDQPCREVRKLYKDLCVSGNIATLRKAYKNPSLFVGVRPPPPPPPSPSPEEFSTPASSTRKFAPSPTGTPTTPVTRRGLLKLPGALLQEVVGSDEKFRSALCHNPGEEILTWQRDSPQPDCNIYFGKADLGPAEKDLEPRTIPEKHSPSQRSSPRFSPGRPLSISTGLRRLTLSLPGEKKEVEKPVRSVSWPRSTASSRNTQAGRSGRERDPLNNREPQERASLHLPSLSISHEITTTPPATRPTPVFATDLRLPSSNRQWGFLAPLKVPTWPSLDEEEDESVED